MKVTIDTKEDSVEDIKKVLHVLHDVLEKKGGAVLNEGTPVDTTTLMGMFGDSSASPQTPTADTAPDFGSFIRLTETKKQLLPRSSASNEEPQVEYY